MHKPTLQVYSSNRALLQNLHEGELLAPSMLIGEFFSQLVIIDDYRALPQELRLPLSMQILKDCALELERAKFLFEQSFLGFLESSQFLFAFFDELAQAQVAIKDIPLLDTYADYEDHLHVLMWLEHRYKQTLEDLKYYDNFILPQGAKMRINEAFVAHFDKICIFVEGFINPIHQSLLAKVADITPLQVHFWLDNFNASLPFLPAQILKDCKPFYRYGVDFKSARKLYEQPLAPLADISVYKFALNISQVALVFAKIDEWTKQGVSEQDIVVIVPDEGFSSYLSLLDRARNLNFAMGKDITHTLAYKALESSLDSKVELPYAQVCEHIQSLLAAFDDRESKKVRERANEVLFVWEYAHFGSCKVGDVVELLLEELKHYRIDDVLGGKIRVMGVLESRGFMYKKAVIVDFNEDVIAHIGAKSDLFLNSHLRKKLNMPTIQDKKQLQRHYYYGIFRTANEVAVAYVENEESQPSLMLEELGIKSEMHKNGDELFALLPQGIKLEYVEDNPKGEVAPTLTPSKLKTLLECPRKYFYQYKEYMRNLPSENSSASMGNLLHACLESVYRPYVQQSVRLNADELFARANAFFESLQVSAYERAEIEILKYELKRMFERENGAEVEILRLEGENMELAYGGFTFFGRPDRIEKHNEGIRIIDYKYRKDFKQSLAKQQKEETATDFALILYMQAFREHYPQYAAYPISAWYWDIKMGQMYEEVYERQDWLLQKLSAFKGEVYFTQCERRDVCRYCEFRELCDR